jgi:hypothetical protein
MPFCSSFVPRAIAANVELDVICLNRARVIAGSFTKLNTAYGPLNREGPIVIALTNWQASFAGIVNLAQGLSPNCDSETKKSLHHR